MGRRSKYTPALADEICTRLAAGETLRQICSGEGMPSESLIRKRAIEDADFGAQYARARNIGLDVQAEGLTAISDDHEIDPNSRRIMIDTRKWLFSKMRPDKYGDSVQLAGDKGNPLEVTVAGVELLASRIDRLITRQREGSIPPEPDKR